jgi:hypothetical protein
MQRCVCVNGIFFWIDVTLQSILWSFSKFKTRLEKDGCHNEPAEIVFRVLIDCKYMHDDQDALVFEYMPVKQRLIMKFLFLIFPLFGRPFHLQKWLVDPADQNYGT